MASEEPSTDLRRQQAGLFTKLRRPPAGSFPRVLRWFAGERDGAEYTSQRAAAVSPWSGPVPRPLLTVPRPVPLDHLRRHAIVTMYEPNRGS
jgi:hypothetical protein